MKFSITLTTAVVFLVPLINAAPITINKYQSVGIPEYKLGSEFIADTK